MDSEPTRLVATAAGLAAAAFSASMYYAAAVSSSQVFGPSLVRATNREAVALTFDDGPSESTPAFLEVLAENGARATFFQVGANALRLPDVARSVAQKGHEIGNHTQTHPRFYLCSPATIRREIEQAQQTLTTIHSRVPALFRAPYGARWFGLFPALDFCNLRSVMWSVSSHDWNRSSEWVARHVIEHTRGGDVVLMHDGNRIAPGDHRAGTVQALRQILASFKARGLQTVTVSELFDLD